MKTLIIGAKGMLGQQLAEKFNDHELLLWDRENLDITDEAMVRQRVLAEKPELIINAAAYNNVDACEEATGYELARQINGYAPQSLARVAEELGAKFVHYSTDYVFDGANKAGYAETDQPKPISKYGETKLLGEKIIAEHVAANGHSGLHVPACFIVRTSRLFGPAAVSDGAKKSFVDVMLKLSETKDALDVVDEEYSCPTYVVDLAWQTRVLIEGDFRSGIYHATNSGACTWADLAVEIFRLTDKNVIINKVPSNRFPRPARRPAFSELLNTKLPALRSWQEALAEYLK